MPTTTTKHRHPHPHPHPSFRAEPLLHLHTRAIPTSHHTTLHHTLNNLASMNPTRIRIISDNAFTHPPVFFPPSFSLPPLPFLLSSSLPPFLLPASLLRLASPSFPLLTFPSPPLSPPKKSNPTSPRTLHPSSSNVDREGKFKGWERGERGWGS